MEYYALIVAAGIASWLLLGIYISLRQRHASRTPRMQEPWPSVTVIVPALNEEQTIEPAMASLLALDYPKLEIIAVDDRSTDRTGAILDRLAAQHHERLRVVHIEQLPAGWLGKCHALASAARHAAGEWSLFTDADVIFQPQAVRTAVAFASAYRADHVVLFPRMLWHGYIEAALLALFSISLTFAFRTWQVESRSPKAFVGIGAFNMIRRSLYESFGGHQPLRLEVADDMKLGYLAKKHGGTSMAVNSDGQVRVRWREGALDIVRGIERSGFAGVDFRWSRITLALLFFPGVMLSPYILPFFSGSSTVLLLSLMSIVMIVITCAIAAHSNGLPLWIGLLHPIACILFVYAIVRSAAVTTMNGGLSWRGTFYSIEALKNGTVKVRGDDDR
jgi:cellulose synthase/poly-beta-1,6-N-acetylglucosamine synthase-like glycosyltransferase